MPDLTLHRVLKNGAYLGMADARQIAASDGVLVREDQAEPSAAGPTAAEPADPTAAKKGADPNAVRKAPTKPK